MVEWFHRALDAGPQLCQKALPPSSRFLEHYAALICGVSLPPGPERRAWIDTGLIHFMMASGSHLMFLEGLLAFLPRTARLTLLTLSGFFNGWSVSIVRSLTRRIFQPIWKNAFRLTPLQGEAAMVFAALLAYPPWLISRAFLMSWMCGLALCLPPLWPRFHFLDVALKIYLFLFPFCWASPITVAWNGVAAPIFGWILFPASLLTLAAHRLVPLTDELWRAWLSLLDAGPQAPAAGTFFRSQVLWWIPCFLHAVLLYGEVQWRRAVAFSSSST